MERVRQGIPPWERLRIWIAWVAAVLLGLAVMAGLDFVGPVIHWDQAASQWLQGSAAYPLTLIGAITEWLFSGQVSLVLAMLGIGLLVWRRRWAWAASLALLFPMIAGEVVLKYTLRRPNPQGFLAVRKLIAVPNPGPRFLFFGFPSGHTSRSAFLLIWLALVLWAARGRLATLGWAVALVVFVGWTRIYAGDHWLMDVLGGWLLATLFLLPAALLIVVQPSRNNTTISGSAVPAHENPLPLVRTLSCRGGRGQGEGRHVRPERGG
ncbi:MAG: phosphatase PAP2 family protein [Chloroflexota bacterium]